MKMSLASNVRKVTMHYKCRNGNYPRNSGVSRFPVPDDKVSWNVPWDQYAPVKHTSKSLINQPWSDPDLEEINFRAKWNALDGKVDRRSHFCKYDIKNGAPINPVGRTGITGRGCLGRWGPNHAADPLVTRWKRNESGEIEKDAATNKPILQFVAIERMDSHEWAIPGGMVDPGEQISATLRREFMEEALNSLGADADEKRSMELSLSEFFKSGIEIYRGYVDDPRNTDNAWTETVCINFHDEKGSSVGKLRLAAGDDAANVRWLDVRSDLRLYATHADFVETTAEKRGSFW